MNNALLAVAAIYALWIFYLAIMNLRRVRILGKLSKVVSVFAIPLLAIGFLSDVAINLVICSVVFLDPPRELTVSARLSRYLPQPGWRSIAAHWIATHLLDPFDPSESHLR